MKKFLYASAVLLLTAWLIGVVIYTVGIFIHLLLITALLLVWVVSRLDQKVKVNMQRRTSAES